MYVVFYNKSYLNFIYQVIYKIRACIMVIAVYNLVLEKNSAATLSPDKLL